MKIFGKEFAGQELLIGAVANIVAFLYMPGHMAIVVNIASSLLWMLGGTFKKSIRRIGVPAIAMLPLLLWSVVDAWSMAATVVGFGVLCIGDGFPDRRPSTLDEGSWLGRLVERFIPDDSIGGPVTKWIVCALYMATTLLYLV